MSEPHSYAVYIVDEDYDTHDFIASFSDVKDAHAKAQAVRDQLEEDGESYSLRVDVVPENEA